MLKTLDHVTSTVCLTVNNVSLLNWLVKREHKVMKNAAENIEKGNGMNLFHLYLVTLITFKTDQLSQVKKNMFLIWISIKKGAGGRGFFGIYFSYCMLSLHNITFPQELLHVGQILAKRNIRY